MTIPAMPLGDRADLRKRQPRWRLLTLLAAVWLCVEGASPAGSPAPFPGSPEPDQGNSPMLKPLEAGTLKAILRKKRGKVVLINLWATWCVPCREEFPDLIRLYGRYQAQGLELILISVDDAEQRGQVEAFLKENSVAAVWLCVEGASPAGSPAPFPGSPEPDQGNSPMLKPLEASMLKAILRKKRGKVILINLWATWCVPCREEFPDLIRLYGKYQAQGLELILISVDDAEQRGQVEAFLKENSVNFLTYISAEESYDALIDFFAPDWIGGFPTTFVIDRKGRLTRSLVGGQDYQVFHKAVAPLLRSGAPAGGRP